MRKITENLMKTVDINFDVTPMIDDVNSDQLQVRSSMTGKHFTIRRSDVNRLVGNYISQSDVDPSLSDAPILAKYVFAYFFSDKLTIAAGVYLSTDTILVLLRGLNKS